MNWNRILDEEESLKGPVTTWNAVKKGTEMSGFTWQEIELQCNDKRKWEGPQTLYTVKGQRMLKKSLCASSTAKEQIPNPQALFAFSSTHCHFNPHER